MHQESTVMRFSVSVPVLSAQMTVTAPRLSTADRRRTSVPRRSIRWVPSASVVVATAGRPSGTAATASEIALRAISSRGTPRRTPRPRAAAQAPSERPTRRRPVRSSCCSSGVGGEPVSATRARTRPISVWRPVPVIDRQAGAFGDDRAGVHHVDAIAERPVQAGGHGDRLGHRDALPGERGLIDAQAVDLDETRVGRHVVTGLEDEHVTRHDRGGRQRRLDAVTTDERAQRGRAPQGCQHALDPALGDIADGGIGGDDGQDDRGLDRRGAQRATARRRRRAATRAAS